VNDRGRENSGTDRKVAFLRDPGSYPEFTERVDAVETHKSWVFLTDQFAYKFKKPIRYNSFDFRSLNTRCANCETEVRLNRRLAPDVYLGVEPLTIDEHGELVIGGEGTLVDCLIKMTRLPEDRMLSSLIENSLIVDAEIQQVARKLAVFYRDAPASIRDFEGYKRHILEEMDRNRRALTMPGRGLEERPVLDLLNRARGFLSERDELFRSRVQCGRIVEGHGDLRPEHICLLPEPVIFDCMEFDHQLRNVDPIDELAFLSLECDRLGCPSIRPILFGVYEEVTDDHAPQELISFYSVYRACIWARLAILRTQELEPSDWGKWIARAETYLEIAEQHCAALTAN
jgi:uncharacterized protein